VICMANRLTSTSSPSPDSGTHAAATVGVSDQEPFEQAHPRRGVPPACIPMSRSAAGNLDAFGPGSQRRAAPPSAARLRVSQRIGEFWGYPQRRAFGELLIDCEEDRTLRAVLVVMLREMERG
jgi:hypothetical protein